MLQRFFHRSESSEPHIRIPSPGVQHREDKPPRTFGFEDQWGLIAGASLDWGRDFTQRASQHPSAPDPRKKGTICQEPDQGGQTYLLVLESLPVSQGGGRGLPQGLTQWRQAYWGAFKHMNGAVRGCHLGLSAPRPGPTQQIVGASAGMPQAKKINWMGRWPTHQQTAFVKTS